jgi:hypothetical protein
MTAAAIALIAAACTETTQTTRTIETPATAETAAAEAANEVDQAVSPDNPITQDELDQGVKATRVDNPVNTFATSTVETAGGGAVGEVRSVNVGADNRAVSLNIEVDGLLNVGERVVRLDASQLTYLPKRNILVTKMTKADIEKMPAVEG